MLTWVFALLAGAAAAAWTYGLRPASRLITVTMVLRGLAVAGIVALLLDAAAGGRRAPRPIVALDVSSSWLRGGDSARFRNALDSARRADGELLTFGDSARMGDGKPAPTDGSSRVGAAVERAQAAGRPLDVITDGELDDPESLAGLSEGSRITVLPASPMTDLAVGDIRVPRSAVAGDTLDVEVSLLAGGAGAPPSRLTMEIGKDRLASVDIDSIGPFGERLSRVRVHLPAGGGSLILRAIVAAPGDREPRNDTLATAIEVSRGAGAVLVSTSPDYDVRELAAVLRGTVSLPTRGFLRVAPGQWREEGKLDAVSESEVKRVAGEAPLLILHGDTSIFGNPRSFARGSLLLLAPPAGTTGEWFATGAPASPMSAALAGSPWDSLPPLDVAPNIPTADFEVLETRRARRLERRVAAVGWERPRRIVLVAADGFWHWRFRGGVDAGVYEAFWGSIIDWLAAERRDARAVVPAAGATRAGVPIRWRRGAGSDSLLAVILSRVGSAEVDTLTLRFPSGALFAQSAPLPTGTWTVTMPGGTAALVVNPSAELVPRRPTVSSGAVGSGTVRGDVPRLRTFGTTFALVILLLCLEWVLRRRAGLR